MPSQQENKKIEQAIIILVDCISQSSLNPKPVILHSLKVGMKLLELGKPTEVVIAGILHDLIEDSNCSLEKIQKKFGSKVAKLVEALTSERSIRDYQKRGYKNIAKIKKAGPNTMLIKVIDYYDNLPYVAKLKDEKKFEEVLWKHGLLIDSFKPSLGKLKIFKDYESGYRRLKLKK